MNTLTPKQRLFVAEYLIDLNATRAAIAAGYSRNGAEVTGHKLLRNAKVAAEISRKQEKRLAKLEITAERVLQELACMGFANLQDYIKFGADGKADVDLSQMTREQAAAVQEFTVDTTGGSGDGERRVVLRNRLKLTDKAKSLELLGKHLKLFTDKVESSGPNGGPIQQSIQIEFIEANGE